MLHRRSTLRLAGTALAASGLAASRAIAQSPGADTIVVAQGADAYTMDPAKHSVFPTANILFHVYEALVTKDASGKFSPQQYRDILRTQGIESVIVVGTITEGCVESTVRSASYRDYYVVVVEDAVASPNAELAAGSLRLFHARYPTHTSAEVLDAIRKAQAGRR